MKILFVVPYSPTLIRVRPHNLLKQLTSHGHAVTLATLWETESERNVLKEFENCGIRVISSKLTKPRVIWNSLSALPTRTPLQARYCFQPQFVRQLQIATRDRNSLFDVAHVEHLRGALYGLLLESNLHAPIVWDSVDCISLLFERAARTSTSTFGRFVTQLELNRTRRYEAWLMHQFPRVLATSQEDARALDQLGSNFQDSKLQTSRAKYSGRSSLTAVQVVPNGVDLEYFTPTKGPRPPDTLVFTGKLSYHANVTAALHLINNIMPLIWKDRPRVCVKIVGHHPTRQIRELVARHQPRVTLAATVPDIRPYLQSATVATAPMQYGAGIQNKVLEAMACATPVVATPQAASALKSVNGEHLFLADGTNAFADRILTLLTDADLRQRIGSGGRAFVEQHHNWGTITQQLESVYREAIDSKQ